MKSNKKKYIIVFGIICLAIVITIKIIPVIKYNTSIYMKAIKITIKDVDSYEVIGYDITENNILRYTIDAHNDYSRCTDVRDRFEDYLRNVEEKIDIEKIEIVFVENPANSNQISIRNFEDDGVIHEYFDIVRIGSRQEGYHFDVEIPDGEYLQGFNKLEIGKDYTLKEYKFMTFHFRGLSIISCYLNEEDFLEFCDFVSVLMPDCKVINEQV